MAQQCVSVVIEKFIVLKRRYKISTKTFTIDTGEWVYPDVTGAPHTVTNAETFTMTMTDGGASSVKYAVADVGQSVVTDDGHTVYFRPISSTMDNKDMYVGFLTDAAEGILTGITSELYNWAGEMRIECPVTGQIQTWKPAWFMYDNADAPTEVHGKWEDQFGNTFSWSAVTVA